MGLGQRIEERLAALKISQAELARRAGVPQTTMNSLIRGNHRSSPHLVRIAQALETTPAYLVGQTDDPSAVGPSGPSLSASAIELLGYFESLPPVERAALLTVARAMCRPGGTATFHEAGAVYRAEERRPRSKLREERGEYEASLRGEPQPETQAR